LRPRTIVELGTMSGNSFGAFAQGVQALGLETACYAVDTWKGDPHSGGYGEEVFEEWSAFHDRHLGAFSRLVRSTFDDARATFDDGSIDLLHIDGFHTYEAVRHDFESWLPKLSTRAVVLLHDINVREQDFGVWKLWHEVSRQYPSFAFLHAHGLGVVGIGRDPSPNVRPLLEDVPRNSRDMFIIRQFFGALGEALLHAPRESELAQREVELRAEIGRLAAARQHETDTLGRALQDARIEVARLSDTNQNLATSLAQAEVSLAQAEENLQRTPEIENRMKEQARAFDQQAGTLQSTMTALQQARTELEDRVLSHRRALEKAEQSAGRWFVLLMRFRESRSWRVTSLFRKSLALVREAGRRARFWKPVPPGATPFLTSLRPSRIKEAALIRRSGLFDEAYYLRHVSMSPEKTPDLAGVWAYPLAHYLVAGAFNGEDPHALFDSSFYLARNPDVAKAGLNPLWHFLTSGGVEGRDPHPLFQSAYYLSQNPDVAEAKLNPLLHFISSGAREGRDPNPWFDTSFYLAADPELRACGENPLVHFLRVGASEERSPGPSFDTRYYARANPDVVESGLNPLTHYILAGQSEGRRTSALPTIPKVGDIQSSVDAYESVTLRARELDALRTSGLVCTPPSIIQLPEQDDPRAHVPDVTLSAEAAPKVSIVIPIVNGVRLTLECLISVSRFSQEVPLEVIVVDNGSTDQSTALLSSIPNLRYVRHEQNLGFGPGNNAGAALARGRYLVFLNNDAQVQSGWLSGLLQAFDEGDRVGAVGPKVLFPDGRLQDAGSTINADCTSSLIGVFDDPALPRFNSAREVDYVSGVCLMVETQLFRDLGGFDPDFAPAYCEDVDLCLRLRQRGFRIIYEPSATIVHHLSLTSSTLGESFKQTAVTCNQQKLSSRHQEQIDSLNRIRIIAFYLPQFHPIPENDVWWGKGFTEWRNVTRARPNFDGHYQPRLPGDLGFYDLRLEETYQEQVKLAERYGVHGFCFYYYWFDGKRLLERPIERLLETQTSDFPFCLCWANENWTRRWDGLEHEVLIAQSHRDEDEVAVIDDLLRYVRYPSYIRVDGRPLLLIYSASRFPNIRKTVQNWRQRCRNRGVGEIYLAMVESFDLSKTGTAPGDWGFDAAVEFPPHHGGLYAVQPSALLNERFGGRVFDYNKTALHYMTRAVPEYRRFRTVMPGWDNTPRRQDDGVIFTGSTPGGYQAWLESVLRQTHEQHFGDERMVFINAWNEWAEGAYLEPDLGWGHAYLEATRDALENVRLGLCSHR
jgi:GT2 family glycosyltransferase